ncbi:MAG: FAD:protein FMN transferase [Solirubrobacteraceae bacterium]
MSESADILFHSMGSDVRVLVGSALLAGAEDPHVAAWREQAYVEDFAARLSRFRSDSELTALNRDPRAAVPASPLLRSAVRAGLWAAQRSDGLVDPTLLSAIERAGYRASLDGCTPASLLEALVAAPARRPARAHPGAAWRQVQIDDRHGLVRRPPGVQIDTGGTGKGLCADAVAYRLRHYERFVVDCGGDLAIGGVGAQLAPYEVEIEHPLSGEVIRRVRVGAGGIATSGLNVRVWRDERGDFAHHLLDPATGRPAWTGLIGVTALGLSALEAETLSKMALLRGPLGARRVLGEHGGLIVHDSGEVEQIGPLDAPHSVLRFSGSAA